MPVTASCSPALKVYLDIDVSSDDLPSSSFARPRRRCKRKKDKTTAVSSELPTLNIVAGKLISTHVPFIRQAAGTGGRLSTSFFSSGWGEEGSER